MAVSETRAKQLKIRDAELDAALKRNSAAGKQIRAERASIKAQLAGAPDVSVDAGAADDDDDNS